METAAVTDTVVLSALTAVAEVADVVLRLVVHPHVIGDVCGRQQFAADVARHLLLVTDHVCTQAILGGKAGLASLQNIRITNLRKSFTRPPHQRLWLSDELFRAKNDKVLKRI